MTNPFEVLEARLSNIESLLLDLKHPTPSQKPPEPEDDLMTVEEAAQFLDLSVATIYTKTSKGELSFMKMKRGKRIYFSRKELIAYLEEGRQKTAAEIEATPEDYLKQPRRGRA